MIEFLLFNYNCNASDILIVSVIVFVIFRVEKYFVVVIKKRETIL